MYSAIFVVSAALFCLEFTPVTGECGKTFSTQINVGVKYTLRFRLRYGRLAKKVHEEPIVPIFHFDVPDIPDLKIRHNGDSYTLLVCPTSKLCIDTHPTNSDVAWNVVIKQLTNNDNSITRYTVTVNGKVIHSFRKPSVRKIGTVKVYNCIKDEQVLKDVVFTPLFDGAVLQTVDAWPMCDITTATSQISTRTKIEDIKVLRDQYVLKFELNPTQMYYPQCVFYSRQNGNDIIPTVIVRPIGDGLDQRQYALQVCNSSLPICTSIPIRNRQEHWSNVVITQHHIGNTYEYRVDVDGKEVFVTRLEKAKRFLNIEVTHAAPRKVAFIRNVVIEE